MSCPIPRVPPVTSATLPVRSSYIRFSLCSAASISARRAVVIWSRCFHELGHLFRSSKADHVRLRDDSLQEAREYGARADFHKARTFAAEPRRMLHAFYPTDGRRELVRQETPRPAARVPGRSSPAFCISSPRRRTSFAASGAVSAVAATYAEYSPSECPAAATASPAFFPTTANTAALCARIAG